MIAEADSDKMLSDKVMGVLKTLPPAVRKFGPTDETVKTRTAVKRPS